MGDMPAEFAASMAWAIEDAYLQSLLAEGKHPFEVHVNDDAARDRRRIFVAIAQGVVRSWSPVAVSAPAPR